MTDGEWWRKSGPWSERSVGGAEDGPARGGAVHGAPTGAQDTAGAPSVPPVPSAPPSFVKDPDSVYDPPAPSAGGIPSVPLNPPDAVDAEARAAAIPPPTVSSTGPWTMTVFDFSDGPEPAPQPVPEQRAGEAAAVAGEAGGTAGQPVQPGADRKARGKSKKLRKARGKAAPEAPAAGAKGAAGKGAAGKAGAGKGATGKGAAGKDAGARKPSPLILLSSALLVGGAVSGFFPVMLAGWGLGYLSRQLSDLTRKFVILGIPLITMSATTLMAMQHAKQGGAQGGGLQSGSPLGQIGWSSAPNVLRVSAVISAVVLLLLGMRRRPPQQG
ncbi:hypothetical protein [Kitasatospora sp. NPDC059599]|uniref:hypothetical protein n=1 Tax=Kitasatospora sp. NPDC059599 TaxID=3346880 RepID=UPI00369B6CF0